MTTSTNPQADTGVASPADVKEPPTGAEFLESLRDGRVIYFDGEEINDVTTHPAFATSARSYARMYDSLHDPKRRDVLTYVTERNTRTHKFYKMAETKDDLYQARDAIAEWARMNFGASLVDRTTRPPWSHPWPQTPISTVSTPATCAAGTKKSPTK